MSDKPITSEELAALVEAERRATPGPWRLDRDGMDEWIEGEDELALIVHAHRWQSLNGDANAAFAIAARNAFPRLLVEVRRLAAERDALRADNAAVREQCAGLIEAAFNADARAEVAERERDALKAEVERLSKRAEGLATLLTVSSRGLEIAVAQAEKAQRIASEAQAVAASAVGAHLGGKPGGES